LKGQQRERTRLVEVAQENVDFARMMERMNAENPISEKQKLEEALREEERKLEENAKKETDLEEIEALICGWSPNVKEYWETPAILDAIVCDHQYTIQSLPVLFCSGIEFIG